MRSQRINQEKDRNLIGIYVRTNNEKEFSPTGGQIGKTVQKYFSQNLAASIKNRTHPGVTICAYTDYETDHTGDYTYFIGEEVTTVQDIPEGYAMTTIPKGSYAKFTSEKGPMPFVVIDLWKRIWSLSPNELGGKRRYATDYEVHDARASDPNNIEIDIYIGL